jgi:hypothetical protein
MRHKQQSLFTYSRQKLVATIFKKNNECAGRIVTTYSSRLLYRGSFYVYLSGNDACFLMAIAPSDMAVTVRDGRRNRSLFRSQRWRR